MRALLESEVAIRRATPGDTPFIHELSQLAFAEFDPNAARATAKMMLESGAQTLVAERDGTPLGFVILHAQSSTHLAINAIAVSLSERGKRIGQRLMLAAEHHARSLGVSRITLSTAQVNLAALDLFLRSGFTITTRNTRYWGNQPACQLEKRIAH
jgi:ribosomal protein S18 acetylase RimI-like enzyme